MLTTRPKIAELVFQLYGRSLHPELFEVHQSRKVQRGDYEAKVQITTAGHVVTWSCGKNIILTEVAASSVPALPRLRRLMSYRVKGEQTARLEYRGGVSYEMAFSLESVKLEKFLAYQREITLQATRQGMLQQFEANGRFEAGALSYVNVESRDKIFRIQAFHTFPDDFAVLRVQSTYRVK